MRLLLALFAIAQPFPVRAELVEALHSVAVGKGSRSTSAGRTGEELAAQARSGDPGQSGKEVARDGGSALDAERAFAAMARDKGQWTAFRAFAADDAIMFAPGPVNAQDFLKGRKDPPRSVDWWPTASYVSCDGGTAVNTGGWRQPDGSVGYFTTVWKRQVDGRWKWVLDSGDGLKVARPKGVPVELRADCLADGNKIVPFHFFDASPFPNNSGRSDDLTLFWGWQSSPSEREIIVTLNGRNTVLDDHIATLAKP